MSENTASSAEQKAEEWPIGELYGKAYRIATKNPVLWWFAIAIGAGAGSSFRGNGGSDISAKDMQFFQNMFSGSPQQSAEKVLGAATSPMGDLFQQIIQAIPWYFYLFFGIEILVLLGIGIAVSIIYRAWAEAALLTGIENGIKDEKPVMKDMSEKAFPRIKSFIWLQVLPSLAFWLISLSLLGMLIFLLIVVPGNLKILLGILLGIAMLVFIIGLLFLTMALIWAPRKVIVDHLSAREAFLVSIHIAKRKFWKTILFGILNNLISLVIFGVAIGIPLVLFVLLGILAGVLWKGMFGLSVTIISIIAVLAVVWIVLLTLLGGIVDSFKAAFWSLAYHKIRGKYEH